jgi:predicted transcriptional regulator
MSFTRLIKPNLIDKPKPLHFGSKFYCSPTRFEDIEVFEIALKKLNISFKKSELKDNFSKEPITLDYKINDDVAFKKINNHLNLYFVPNLSSRNKTIIQEIENMYSFTQMIKRLETNGFKISDKESNSKDSIVASKIQNGEEVLIEISKEGGDNLKVESKYYDNNQECKNAVIQTMEDIDIEVTDEWYTYKYSQKINGSNNKYDKAKKNTKDSYRESEQHHNKYNR